MKKVVDAVRYGIETLKISPEELFSMFKVVHTDGIGETSSYPLWLAGEILKIAEKEEVGYSQLMVKKFAITQEILEGKEAIIKEEYLSKFLGYLSGSLYTVDFDEFEESSVCNLSEVDWVSGIDYDDVISEFLDTTPEEFAKNIRGGNSMSVMARLGSGSCPKNSALALNAKAVHVKLNTEGGAFLYRMCSLSDVFELGENFKLAFLVNTDFLTSELNADVLKHFLRYFKYKGAVLKASDLFEDYSIGGTFAFLVCTPRVIGDVMLDSIVLKDSDGVSLRYTRGKIKYREYLKRYSENTSGGNTKEAVYLTLGRLRVVPDEGDIVCSENNFEDCVVYFSVVSSLVHFGLSGEIPLMVTGDTRYKHLVGNCLPLFVFDSENRVPMFSSNEYLWLKYLITELGEECTAQFSYEAKELVSVGTSILDYAKKKGIETKGKSFNEIRQELNMPELNSAYIEALTGLKGYIKSFYREMA